MFLILNYREKVDSRVSQAIYGEKEILRKLAKMLVPIFNVNLRNTSFLSCVLSSMHECELTMDKLFSLLSSKEERKKFTKMKHVGEPDPSQTNRKNVFQNPLQKRRSLRYENANIRHHRDFKQLIGKKNSRDHGIPPSLQSKKRTVCLFEMFHIPQGKSKSRQKQV